MNKQEILQKLVLLVQNENLKIYTCSVEIGISIMTLSDILAGKRNMQTKTAWKIEQWLNTRNKE